ncbi:Checkpoint protein hus1 [Rhodotorula kratochvilovae]
MRFKAQVSSPTQFSRLITSLAPLSKTATLKLKRDQVHLICGADSSKSALQVWSVIQVDSIFNPDTLRLDSNHNNEIYLEVSTDILAKALKSATDAIEVVIKLAKKGGRDGSGTGEGSYPVLSLAIQSASRLGKRVEITQDVPVLVKKAADIDQLKEPLCPPPEVLLYLPPLNLLRTVVERLKTISPYITLSANNVGELRLRAESDDAKVETEWRGLRRPTQGAEDIAAAPADPREFFAATVEAKDLLKFLASYSIASTTIAWHCAIFYVYIGAEKDSQSGGGNGGSGGVLTFFVPAVKLGGDE